MQACTSSLSVDRSAPLRNMRRSRRPPVQCDEGGLSGEEGKGRRKKVKWGVGGKGTTKEDGRRGGKGSKRKRSERKSSRKG